MNIVVPEGMTDSAMLALIVGFLSPLVLNFIVKATWPNWSKSLAAFLWSALAGSITAYFAGAFTGLGVVSTVLLVLVVSITAYQNFWKQVAPTLQRGSAEKAALVVEEKNREASIIAAKVIDEIPTGVVVQPGAITVIEGNSLEAAAARTLDEISRGDAVG